MNKTAKRINETPKEDDENANLSFKERYIPRFGKAFQGATIAIEGGLKSLRNPELKSNYASFITEVFIIALGLYAVVGVISFFLAPLFAFFGFAPVFQLITMVPLWAMSLARKRSPLSSNRLFLSELKTLDSQLGQDLETMSKQGESKGWANGITQHLLKSFHFAKFSLLFTLMGLIPIAGPILSSISQVIFNASKLGWNLMTVYTVSCKKMTYKQHKRWIRARRWTLLGFGLVYSSMVSIPFVGPLALGFAQASSAHLQQFGFYNADIPLKKRERREKERKEREMASSSEGMAPLPVEPASSGSSKPRYSRVNRDLKKDAPAFIPMVKEPSFMKRPTRSASMEKSMEKDRLGPLRSSDLLEPKKSS
eukprot:TRINITY_DN1441_c0_g1_i1.p1 TRINITY_DN1441_c0_g1~~TRINITY_DN1441_c0_g1_i1.p1  ORF type:complete len:367 (-),score=104.08 TRINITY_DN1441_c0_g1_i1:68-1168(-)